MIFYGVVPSHLAFMLEAQDSRQVEVLNGAISAFGLSRWHSKTPVEGRQEPPEYIVGLLHGACTSQAKLRHKAILKCPSHSLNAALGLGASSKYLAYPRLQECSTYLSAAAVS